MAIWCGAVAYFLWGASQANAAVLIQYEFLQEECRRGIVEDVIGGDGYFGDIILDNSTSSCLSGIGMERTSDWPGSPGASSVGNITSLREKLAEDQSSPGRFSLELWLSIDSMPACDSFCTTPLVTIGERGVSVDDDCQENMGMMITYWTETGDFGARFQSTRDSCERFWSGAVQPTESMGYAFHLVFTVDETELNGEPYAYFEWFINGTRVAWDLSRYVPPRTMMASWDAGFHLQLLDSSRQIPSSFYRAGPGIQIFFLAIHNETMENTEVLSRYASRLAGSTPVVRDATTYVMEDGESGDHYEEPESYLQVFPASELQLIPLDWYDSDNDPATPNYDNSTPRVFVCKLPAVGSLVNSSDGTILSAPFEVFGDGGEFAVRYRPILNDFSTNATANNTTPYAFFSFYATDGESGARSHGNATVSIFVLPKNDPPGAFAASQDVFAGTRNNIISLQGFDLDAGDDVYGAAIVDLPARGALFQVFENGTASNVPVSIGEVLWRQFVAYEHNRTWLRSNSPAEQTVGSDIFTFKVFDSHFNYSLPAIINISVVAGVSALAHGGSLQCFEEVDCDVRLFGSAIDDTYSDLSVTISAPPIYGNLFDPVTNISVAEGSVLSSSVFFPYEVGASVMYRSPMDFFTDPDTQWNGTQLLPVSGFVSISFYVSIKLGNAQISSAEVTQELKIVNVNDNSTLMCGDSMLQTQATGVVGDDRTFDYPRPDHLFIDDFFISEEDRGVDPVRASIEVESGYLTLNETLLSRVSFEYLCSGTRSWRCKGDGFYSQSMVFVGAPKDIQNVLNGMLFISYERNTIDNITVTIYDGFEGDCIWEFTTFSVRPGCASSTCSIFINVTETWFGEGTGEALITLNWLVALVLFMSLCALLGALLSCCFKHLILRLLRLRRSTTIGRKGSVRSTSSSKQSRRTPANIPLGSAQKKGSGNELGFIASKNTGKVSIWGRIFGRGSVAASQGITRSSTESGGELTWEDNG